MPRLTLRLTKWPSNSSHSEGVGWRVLLTGPGQTALPNPGAVVADDVFGIDRGVDLGRDALVAQQHLHDVRRQATGQGVGGEDPAEIVTRERDRLAVDAQVSAVGEAAEQGDEGAGGDGFQLGPVGPADEVGQGCAELVLVGIQRWVSATTCRPPRTR